MTLYSATPINSRTEKTLAEKLRAARHRINLLSEVIRADARFKDYGQLVSTFSVNPAQDMEQGEAAVMGRCVEQVLKADAIYLDHGWTGSKGCNLEYRAAKTYDKAIYEHDKL